jgi:hypothetical protein
VGLTLFRINGGRFVRRRTAEVSLVLSAAYITDYILGSLPLRDLQLLYAYPYLYMKINKRFLGITLPILLEQKSGST